jgi:hypothetical protein
MVLKYRSFVDGYGPGNATLRYGSASNLFWIRNKTLEIRL